MKRDIRMDEIDKEVEKRVDNAMESMLSNVKDFIEISIQNRLASEV